MTGGWIVWRRLLAFWLPAVVLCVVSIAVYVWLGSVGREAQLRERVEELEGAIVRLERVREQATEDSVQVDTVKAELERIYVEVFGNLDERLVPILRAVESSAREANLLPAAFSYDADEDRTTGSVRFSVSFSVVGSYQQIRTMLGSLQSSSEFLIIDSLAFRGEQLATSRDIQITISLATVLAEADREKLRKLTVEGR